MILGFFVVLAIIWLVVVIYWTIGPIKPMTDQQRLGQTIFRAQIAADFWTKRNK